MYFVNFLYTRYPLIGRVVVLFISFINIKNMLLYIFNLMSFIFLYYLNLFLKKLWRAISSKINLLQTVKYIQLYHADRTLRSEISTDMVEQLTKLQLIINETNLGFFINFFILCRCWYMFYTTPTPSYKTYRALFFGTILHFLLLDFALFLVTDFNKSIDLIRYYKLSLGHTTPNHLPYLFFIYI